MRSYKEIADIVREKGNTILEQKKKRTLCIKKVSFPISGLCAAILVCFGVIKLIPTLDKNNSNFVVTDIIVSTETTTDNTISTKNTNKLFNSTTTAKTTYTTSNIKTPSRTTISSITYTDATPQSTQIITYNTTVFISTIITTEIEPIETTTIMPNALETTALNTNPITTSTIITTSAVEITDIQNIFRSSSANFKSKRTNYSIFEKQNIRVEPDRIGNYIYDASIVIDEDYFSFFTMEAHEINGINENEAVAIKLTDTNEFYLFKKKDYKNELIS